MRYYIILILAVFCPVFVSGQLSPQPEAGFLAGQAINTSQSSEPGLLFYLSGDREFTADFAGSGQDKPNFRKGVIADYGMQ